jgi:hypothetical protein
VLSRSLVALGLAIVAGAGTAAAVRTMVVSPSRIGAYAPRSNPSFRAARAVFGAPSTVIATGPSGNCVTTWPGIGLTMRFYTLGITKDRCASFASAEMTGRAWRTPRGLANGDSLARLKRLYPNARLHSGPAFAGRHAWWLVTRTYRVGPFPYPGLYARVRSGQVVALGVSYPGGGD